jgi:hypothetical protein
MGVLRISEWMPPCFSTFPLNLSSHPFLSTFPLSLLTGLHANTNLCHPPLAPHRKHEPTSESNTSMDMQHRIGRILSLLNWIA